MAQELPLPGGGEQHAHIVFSLQQDEPDRVQSALDEERKKHMQRAERFGTTYVDPGRVRKDFGLMMEARKQRLRASHGFKTGELDVFSPEEREKRAARAARFRLEGPLVPSLDAYKPDGGLEARVRRAVKFGVPYQPTDAVLMDMDLYEQRREVGKEIERRPNAIYLYGVDVMSTKEVLSYFSDYGPVFVEWLDDSSCNVLFDDSNSVKRAIVGKGTPLPPEVVARPGQQLGQAEQQQQADSAAAAPVAVQYRPELPVPDNLGDVANLPYLWHKGQDFAKDGTSVSLVFRMATMADTRDMTQPKRTRELWKSVGGGDGSRAGRAGRGRGQQKWQGKRPHRQAMGGDGPADMEVDDGGPGSTAGGEDGGDVPMKRARGTRGGQRLAMKEVRPALQPYGGTSLLQVGSTVLPAKGHVLDYTELEDEDPASAAVEAEAVRPRNGSGAGGSGGAGRRGRRGGQRGGSGGGDGGKLEGDLREVLNARRSKQLAPAKGGPGQGSVENGEAHGEDGPGLEDYGGEAGRAERREDGVEIHEMDE
ncbi:hypothetical protein VaNZ11_012421 [Volvox africanus]|uniref:Nuclear cap-binding protein subunit 3 n=1 Tax=Volvox africanus TaxID=51714 RepID=A0ABQ5SEL5_9CHLO|nr:hypothetical protein VaNZ11_012421 [Volvox africanus]